MDPHHEMATPQWLLDTIGQTHNVKVKVSDRSFTEKYHNCFKGCMSSSLARCKNHLCRSVTADIKGEKLPGPIVTCNSSFGETFYIGSSSGGSVPTNDSEIHRSDYLYKGTALHLAAQIAILDVAGYCFPSVYQCLNCWSPLTDNKSLVAGFDQKVLIVFRKS
ncbi:hypothetical protein YC2023_045874 [Brassica napus]